MVSISSIYSILSLNRLIPYVDGENIKKLRKLIKSSLGSRNIIFFEKIKFFQDFLYIYVFKCGLVCLIYKDKQYLFENPFGKHLNCTFQLFVQDDIVVLFSGLMFVSFVFEKGGFSKIEFKRHNEWPYKRFVKSNIIVLCIGRMILSFTLENRRFTMRNYPIRHGIDGGILIFVEGTPYFVCCIHPRNSPLIVVSINLITGQQNTVLEIGEDEYFISFQMNDYGSLSITTTSRGDNTISVVNPLIIYETRESWRQDGGILWDRVRSC
jgi:hypothetical protein